MKADVVIEFVGESEYFVRAEVVTEFVGESEYFCESRSGD